MSGGLQFRQWNGRPLFTATPNDDGAVAAMTTNCGQLPAPNSVIGATMTTGRYGAAREASGTVGGKLTVPEARSAEERKRRGSTARSGHLRAATLVWSVAG